MEEEKIVDIALNSEAYSDDGDEKDPSYLDNCSDETESANLLKMWPLKGERKISKELKQAVRDILKAKKKVICPQSNCGKSCRTISGFEYHVQHCVMSQREKYKMRYNTRRAQECRKSDVDGNAIVDFGNDVMTDADTERNVGRKSKRVKQAAITNEGDDVPDDDESPHESSHYISYGWLNHYEAIPVMPEDLPEQYTNLTMLTEALKLRSRLKCPNHCGRNFRKASVAYDHIKNCNKKLYKHCCKLCNKVLTTRHGIKQHLISKHRKKAHDSENDEESEFSETERSQTKQVKGKMFGKQKIDYEMQTKSWQEAFYGKENITSWKPSKKHWKQVHHNDMAAYLPIKKKSNVFTIEAIDKVTNSKEYQLPLFSSTPVNSDGGVCNITLNVGGSVWAMDWVPTPLNEGICDQYLAIGCHSNPDEEHLLSNIYTEKSLIQIWKFPQLRNGMSPSDPAVFSLGILHDNGPVWDLRWCPSSTWDSSQCDDLRRLGLLACACADGKIRIFSVPFPSSLNEHNPCNGESSKDMIYRAIPHMELSPGSACRKYNGECGPSWSLAWYPLYDHGKLVASFGDGTVALWDLSTESPILKRNSSDGLTVCFYPVSHFQAHSSVIRALAWCPSDPNYIATGGYDKLIHVWDLRHPSQPVLQMSKTWCYSLTWPLHWGLLIYNTEILSRIRGTRVLEYYHGSKSDRTQGHTSTCYIKHNATVWDNDFSHWSNFVASVDAAGVLSINYLPEAFNKSTVRNKRTIFRGIIESGHNHDDDFKITFKDSNPSSAKSAESEKVFNDTATVLPSEVAHTALHKVRWNPNCNSFNWLAAGGRLGLVRVCYPKSLDK